MSGFKLSHNLLFSFFLWSNRKGFGDLNVNLLAADLFKHSVIGVDKLKGIVNDLCLCNPLSSCIEV